jgi:surface antigen
MGKRLAAVAAAIAGLGLGGGVGGAWAQDMSTMCQQVVGQAEIGGVMQTIAGVACLQPDGTWQMVDSSSVGYGGGDYYYDPWYWTPYVGFAGVIFIDHHHRPHVMHHVFFPSRGVIVRGGRVVHGGAPGGFHGGAAPAASMAGSHASLSRASGLPGFSSRIAHGRLRKLLQFLTLPYTKQ